MTDVDQNLQDCEWAELAALGDQTAFTQLATRYRNYIYSLCYKMTHNEEDALDVTQNVFMRLTQKIGEFKGSGAFRSWLARVAVREALNFLRRPSRREYSTDPQVMHEIIEGGAGDGPDETRERIERGDRMALVEKAMKTLSAQQRAIMLLQLKEGLGPKEISAQLVLPASQVRTQLHRALGKVRGELGLGPVGSGDPEP